MSTKRLRATCSECGKSVAVHPNGALYAHSSGDASVLGTQFGGGYRLSSTPCRGKAVIAPGGEHDG